MCVILESPEHKHTDNDEEDASLNAHLIEETLLLANKLGNHFYEI